MHLPRRCRYGGDLGRTLGFPVQAGHAHHPQRSTPLLSNIPSGRSTPPTNFTICPRYVLVKGIGRTVSTLYKPMIDFSQKSTSHTPAALERRVEAWSAPMTGKTLGSISPTCTKSDP